MTECAYCGTFILFGGVRDNGFRFCNAKCHQKASWLKILREMPSDVVEKHVGEIHRGLCPKCQGSGPIDVHTSYRIYSLLLYRTSCRSQQHICCRSCGMKTQIGDAIISFLFGWWGFNWGFFVTPVLVVLNIVNAINGPDEMRPSEKLQNIVRRRIALNLLSEQMNNMT